MLVDRVPGAAWCSVGVDDVEGGELAVTHLVEQGHQRIAFVGGPMTTVQVADRLPRRPPGAGRGRARPRRPLTVLETAALNVAEGRRAGERLVGLPRARRPTAAFCANDLVALGLLQQMTRLGVDVPGELAIVGYDDIEFAGAAAVPLSSVRQPRQLLGRTAAELLLAESDADDAHVHQQVLFRPELVVRTSSANRPPLSPPAARRLGRQARRAARAGQSSVARGLDADDAERALDERAAVRRRRARTRRRSPGRGRCRRPSPRPARRAPGRPQALAASRRSNGIADPPPTRWTTSASIPATRSIVATVRRQARASESRITRVSSAGDDGHRLAGRPADRGDARRHVARRGEPRIVGVDDAATARHVLGGGGQDGSVGRHAVAGPRPPALLEQPQAG